MPKRMTAPVDSAFSMFCGAMGKYVFLNFFQEIAFTVFKILLYLEL